MQNHSRAAVVALEPSQIHKMHIARKVCLDRRVAVEGATSRRAHKCADWVIEVVVGHVRKETWVVN